MTAVQARQVLRANAVFDFAAGLLLLVRDLRRVWNALDLPQGQPALLVQVGGATPVGLAHVLLQAADHAPLRGPVANAAAGVVGLAALIVLVWLLAGSRRTSTRSALRCSLRCLWCSAGSRCYRHGP